MPLAVGSATSSPSVLVIAGGEAGALVGGHVEAGVAHAERREDVVAHEVGQRLAGELLDDVALDVHGHAVDPAVCRADRASGILREAVDHLLEVLGVADSLSSLYILSTGVSPLP